VFVLTLVVVDDIDSLVVIAVAYTRDLSLSGRSQRRSASRHRYSIGAAAGAPGNPEADGGCVMRTEVRSIGGSR
jgi:hypothetical protein